MHQHAFLLQMAREVGGCLVVSRHHESLFEEVAGDGTHSDAAGTNEVDCFDILNHFYLRFTNLRFKI